MGRNLSITEDRFVAFPLAAILERKGVTQSELARRTGIAHSYINRLTRKKTNPNWTTIMVIAIALDLNIGDFLES